MYYIIGIYYFTEITDGKIVRKEDRGVVRAFPCARNFCVYAFFVFVGAGGNDGDMRKRKRIVLRRAEFAERRIARFGNAEELGYDEDPPIAVLKISCRAGKFASSLSHRDYLGAILNLGIEREKIGDIFVNGQFCYVVTTEIPAETIKRELCRVGREQVVTESAEEIPETFAPKTEEKEIIVSSYRTDVFVCAVWNLSRSDGQKLFEKQFVSVDGKVPGGGDKELKRGAVVTARGYGKFRVGETLGKTKKNNFAVKIERYV